MTITSRIHEELFTPSPSPSEAQRLLIRMPLSHPRGGSPDESARTKRRRQRRRRGAEADPSRLALAWTPEEHERFLRGLERFPRGPWKDVARFVGSRTVRQTMTHAQKYRQKIARHKRGLQPDALKTPRSTTPTAASVVTVTVTPSACTSSGQPIDSPSSMEELAFDHRAEVASWQGLAAFSPPSTPLDIGDAGCTTETAMEFGDGDVALLLDDAELDALVIDDVIHCVISQYLGQCPADTDNDNDNGDAGDAAWSFV